MRAQNGHFATREQFVIDRFAPLFLMFLTGVMSWSIKTGVRIAQAWDETRVVETTPTPPPQLTPVPTVEPKVVEATPEKSEREQIIAYIVEVFGEHAPDAFNVLYCENKNLDPNAINYNRNGTVDRGIFQLNSRYWGGEENFDWKVNIDKARMIFDRAGQTWKPWTCAYRVGQANYLDMGSSR